MNKRRLTNKKIHRPLEMNSRWLWSLLLFSLLLGITTSFFIFPQITLAQEGWTTLFQDDFEDGNANGWQLVPGYQVEQENGNYILSGSGHSYLTLGVGNKWTDYRFNLRIKIIQEAVHLNVRHSDKGRYFIGFGGGASP